MNVKMGKIERLKRMMWATGYIVGDVPLWLGRQEEELYSFLEESTCNDHLSWCKIKIRKMDNIGKNMVKLRIM